jgi:hypothetical protein
MRTENRLPVTPAPYTSSFMTILFRGRLNHTFV